MTKTRGQAAREAREKKEKENVEKKTEEKPVEVGEKRDVEEVKEPAGGGEKKGQAEEPPTKKVKFEEPLEKKEPYVRQVGE
jgi:hypothetical protein